MDTTDGLVRGQTATDTGSPISMPVGPETLGRIMNVIGEPVDERGEINTKQKYDKYPTLNRAEKNIAGKYVCQFVIPTCGA